MSRACGPKKFLRKWSTPESAVTRPPGGRSRLGALLTQHNCVVIIELGATTPCVLAPGDDRGKLSHRDAGRAESWRQSPAVSGCSAPNYAADYARSFQCRVYKSGQGHQIGIVPFCSRVWPTPLIQPAWFRRRIHPMRAHPMMLAMSGRTEKTSQVDSRRIRPGRCLAG